MARQRGALGSPNVAILPVTTGGALACHDNAPPIATSKGVAPTAGDCLYREFSVRVMAIMHTNCLHLKLRC